MKNDNNSLPNYRAATRVLAVFLAASIVLIIILLNKLGKSDSEGVAMRSDYEEVIQQLNADGVKIEAERSRLSKQALDGEMRMDSLVREKNNELSAYKEKSRKEKNDLLRRFQDGVVISDDGNTASFDSSGVDSINRYVIDCEGIKKELSEAKLVITDQKGVIVQDSLAKAVLTEKFDIADKEVKRQTQEAQRQKTAKRFFQGLCASAAIIQASIIYVLVTR